MSQPRKIHLFNCDRTYKFEAVEGLLEATKAKVGSYSVERHYFSLAQMPEMTTKTIPKLDMNMAFFVVHAHESRLSINEDNAGIGYAKIYRALLEATGGKVIIVIGGDDNYKNEDEEDQVVISRWAKRKISSQFKDEFLDGRKSFIFSWNKKHRTIHEEALLHHLDPSKKGQKFEYKPKPKGGGSKSAQSLQRGHSVDEERREGSSRIPSDKAGQKREVFSRSNTYSGELSREDSSSRTFYNAEQRREEKRPQQRPWGYDSPQYDATSFSHTTGGSHPLQSDANFPQKTGENYQSSLRTTGGFDPLQSHADVPQKRDGRLYPSLSLSSSATKEKPNLSSEHVGGRTEHVRHPLSTKKQKDLVILGWEAKPELMRVVWDLIQRHRHELNLAEEPTVRNESRVIELTSYLESNPLKFCVLLVDAKKVKSSPEPQADYLKLLETAERNIATKVIIIVSSVSDDEEEVIHCTIKSKFKEQDKVEVTSFKKGKIALKPEQFLKLMMSTIPNTNPYPQEHSGAPQIPDFGPTIHPPPHKSAPPFDPDVTVGSQCYAHPPGIVARQPSYTHAETSVDLRPALAPAKTVMLNTRLRNGRISNRPEDIVYWKPGWVVPDEIEKDLFRKHSKKSDVELVILLDEKSTLICQVNEKKSSQNQPERQQHPELAPGETIKLKTRMYSGRISFDAKDLEVFDNTRRVPDEVTSRLFSEYRSTPKADLLIVSDSKDNMRCIVQVGSFNKAFRFINKTLGTNAIL